MHGPMIFLDKNKQELMTKMTKVIKNWLFSFMKDNCETEEEYKASKYLLMKLVKSQYVKDNLGTFFTANFLSFFRKHVEVFEHSFVFWRRKNIRHYGEYSNSTHEGTHNRMKHSMIYAVNGKMKLQSSLINLTKRGEMKLRDKSVQYDNSYRTKKPYAIYEAEDNLVPYAASHLQSVFNAFNIFESQRVSNTTWFVQRIVDKPESTLIPKFLRLRSVKYD